MRTILGAGKVYHAINTGKGCAVTTTAMRIKFLLGQDVTTRLDVNKVREEVEDSGVEKETSAMQTR